MTVATGVQEQPAVSVRSIAKAFGHVEALRGASLDLPKGQVTALVGDNGAGKSTLVKIICGAQMADEGEMLVDGSPAVFRSPEDAQKDGIEAVYQDLAIATHLTVVENFFLGRELMRPGLARIPGLQDRRTMLNQTREALDELHIKIPFLTRPMSGLSGGQRQAVAVAKAATWARHIVVMDEPTAALGVSQTEAVLRLIEKVRATGRAVLLISHSLPDVFEVSDRIAVMRRGRISALLDPHATTREEVVGHITGALGSDS